MLNKKIIGIFVCIFLLSISAGALSSANTTIKFSNKESSNFSYSHNILGEFFTMTTCVPCKYSHRALKNLYDGEYHPFNYISMVYVKNKWAQERYGELDVDASPTVMWDGPFEKVQGSTQNIEQDMARYNSSIIDCGNRNVKDIDLSLNVEWLGAVNINPADVGTDVPILQVMSWTISEMGIDVEVTNNEASQYNGHLHVYVTEIKSAMWNDQWGDPYTFAFLDYAWNEDITIGGGGIWDDTIIWDGYDHQTGYDEFYKNITQDNIMVIATIFNEDNNDYADETTAARTGFNTDPKYFDIYFGDTNPPPKIYENVSFMQYSPQDPLNFGTKYYWKIDIWDNQSTLIPGHIMSFTTIENDLPLTPTIFKENDRLYVSTLDPDGDDVFYLIDWGDGTTSEWLGSYQSGEIVEISHGWSEPGTYEIKAKAKDIHSGESDWSDPYTIVVENVQPSAPTVTGPNNGKPGEELTFIFNSVDPDADSVKYHIEWGDGNTDVTEFNPSGTDVTVSHTYAASGKYTITAYAEDTAGNIGESSTFQVTMPKEKTLSFLLQRILERFPNIFLVIRQIMGL